MYLGMSTSALPQALALDMERRLKPFRHLPAGGREILFDRKQLICCGTEVLGVISSCVLHENTNTERERADSRQLAR